MLLFLHIRSCLRRIIDAALLFLGIAHIKSTLQSESLSYELVRTNQGLLYTEHPFRMSLSLFGAIICHKIFAYAAITEKFLAVRSYKRGTGFDPCTRKLFAISLI